MNFRFSYNLDSRKNYLKLIINKIQNLGKIFGYLQKISLGPLFKILLWCAVEGGKSRTRIKCYTLQMAPYSQNYLLWLVLCFTNAARTFYVFPPVAKVLDEQINYLRASARAFAHLSLSIYIYLYRALRRELILRISIGKSASARERASS